MANKCIGIWCDVSFGEIQLASLCLRVGVALLPAHLDDFPVKSRLLMAQHSPSIRSACNKRILDTILERQGPAIVGCPAVRHSLTCHSLDQIRKWGLLQMGDSRNTRHSV